MIFLTSFVSYCRGMSADLLTLISAFETLYWNYCKDAERLSDERATANLAEPPRAFTTTPMLSPTKGAMTPRTWQHGLTDSANGMWTPSHRISLADNVSPTKAPTRRQPAPYPGPTRHSTNTSPSVSMKARQANFPSAKAIRAYRDSGNDVSSEVVDVSSDEENRNTHAVKDKTPAGKMLFAITTMV